jgi:hypothetical protein
VKSRCRQEENLKYLKKVDAHKNDEKDAKDSKRNEEFAESGKETFFGKKDYAETQRVSWKSSVDYRQNDKMEGGRHGPNI